MAHHNSDKKIKKSTLKKENILQSILFADSFMIKLFPITKEKPKVLLPLINIPMLEYSLETLAISGVMEVLIICCNHGTQIIDYIKNSKWSSNDVSSKIKVTPFVIPDAYSTGDALRRVFQLQLIRSDPFIMISGDVVTNINLKGILASHAAAREVDKTFIMSMLMVPTAPGARSRDIKDELIVSIAPNNELLLYDNTEEALFEPSIDLLLVDQEIRYDLSDTLIYVCSEEVLALFNTHFDLQDLSEFVRSVLDDEVMDDKIRVHIQDGYAARVTDFRSYDAISKDIIQRFAHPIVPDSNFTNVTNYKASRNNIYKEDVKIARTANIGKNNVIGNKTLVGENTVIINSVIGPDCVIGSNCHLENVYLWGNNKIGDNSTVLYSILCDGSSVKNDCKVNKGCVLSFNTVVGSKMHLMPYTKLSAISEVKQDNNNSDEGPNSYQDEGLDSGDFDDEIPETPANLYKQWDYDIVGVDGVGFKTIDEVDSLNSIHPDISEYTDRKNRIIYAEAELELQSKSTNFIEEEDPDKFLNEIIATLNRGETLKLDLESVIVEMQALKMACNQSFTEYSFAALSGLYSLIDPIVIIEGEPSKKHLAALNKLLNKWKVVFARFIGNDSDRMQMIHGLEQASYGDNIYYFRYTLQMLYQAKIVSEEVILRWEDTASEDLLQKAKPLLDWFKNAEEEDEEDDDEEEDED